MITCGTSAAAPLTVTDIPCWNDADEIYLLPDIFQFDDPSITFYAHFLTGYDHPWFLSPAMLTPLNDSIPELHPAISFDQLLTGGDPLP